MGISLRHHLTSSGFAMTLSYVQLVVIIASVFGLTWAKPAVVPSSESLFGFQSNAYKNGPHSVLDTIVNGHFGEKNRGLGLLSSVYKVSNDDVGDVNFGVVHAGAQVNSKDGIDAGSNLGAELGTSNTDLGKGVSIGQSVGWSVDTGVKAKDNTLGLK